jgi:diguanylate cyclase (GGDEF)-like protein
MSEETTGVPEIQPEPENRHGLAELYESTRAIGLHDNLDELLREVVDRAQELIGFEHAALMLLDEKTDRLSVAHLKGYGERADEVRRLTLARGEGLSGWAAKHRESVRVGDVSQDPRYVEGLAEARSNLAVPLVVGSEVAGVINVESERPDAFTSEHEKLLTVLGAQAALAILTFRSQEALQQRLAQLGALFRISQLASEGGNLGVALNSMLEIAAEVIPQGQSAILLLDEKKGTLSVKAGQGYGANVQYLEISLGNGVTGRCAQTGETQVISDLDDIPQDRYIPGVPGARSEVAVPLIAEGRIIGVFNAESVEPFAFEPEEVQTLTVIARQAAQVIRSAQLLEETRRLAITDSLTELYNRRHFTRGLEENLSRAARYDERLALILLDVDHFKRVNDRFGHHVGDRCLQLIAHVLRESVRESDQIARIGGEEFAVLLQRADQDLVLSIADRLRDRIQNLVLDEDPTLPIDLTASVGVAFFPEQAEEPKGLFRLADKALYEAKRLGRNRIAVFSGTSEAGSRNGGPAEAPHAGDGSD